MASILASQNLDQCIVVNNNPALNLKRPQLSTADVTNSPRQTDIFNNNHPAAYVGRNATGLKATTYTDDFYHRIRYLPVELNIGAVTSTQTREMYVFNGFFTNKTLESIDVTNPEGITLTGPITPTEYYPLALSRYEVSAGIEGPATIDSLINFNWEAPEPDRTISIRGSRLITLPYMFALGSVETLQWRTQIILSNQGEEQRIKNRGAPRQGFKIDVHIPKTDWTLSDNVAYGWRGNIWGVPVFPECRKLTSAVVEDALFLTLDTTNADFRDGQLLMVMDTINSYEVVQIATVSAGSVELTQGIPRAFPIGALVCPVISARMTSDPIRNTTGAKVRLKASFESVNNIRLTETLNPALDVYKTLPVQLREPLYSGNTGASDTYNRKVTIVDNGSSDVDTFSPWARTKVTRRALYELNSQADLWQFRLWLHSIGGRWKPFYIPTYESNFNFLDVGNIGGSITVVNDSSHSLQGNDRRDIAMKHSGGWSFAEVISISTVSENLVLTLDAPFNIESDNVEFICYLRKCRLASDTVEIIHNGNFTATCSLPIMEY